MGLKNITDPWVLALIGQAHIWVGTWFPTLLPGGYCTDSCFTSNEKMAALLFLIFGLNFCTAGFSGDVLSTYSWWCIRPEKCWRYQGRNSFNCMTARSLAVRTQKTWSWIVTGSELELAWLKKVSVNHGSFPSLHSIVCICSAGNRPLLNLCGQLCQR